MIQKKPFTGEPPKVTGLSPKEGPPGTLITIRGENLGESEDDLIGVSICDIDCLIWSEWKSSSKIIARSGIAYGLGDVIVFTKSGGIGTCTVQFKSIKEIISPIKESSVWVNEDEYFTYINNMHSNSVSPTFYKKDPLGLKLDDTQTNMVRPKLKDTVIYDFFPEIQAADENESSFSDFCSPNFLPAWYLLENYNFIKFDDLKNALKHLKEKNDSKSVKPEDESIKLLKPNVLAVIECLDSLKAVNLAFKKDKQELGELTQRLEDSIKKATVEAHEIFDQILARKDAVDSTRNALNVLQRYRFLFNLPSSIEANIQKQDYEQVINDYLRAKSLFSDTQVKIFERVFKEVETKIEKFKLTLKDRLIKTCKEI